MKYYIEQSPKSDGFGFAGKWYVNIYGEGRSLTRSGELLYINQTELSEFYFDTREEAEVAVVAAQIKGLI